MPRSRTILQRIERLPKARRRPNGPPLLNNGSRGLTMARGSARGSPPVYDCAHLPSRWHPSSLLRLEYE